MFNLKNQYRDYMTMIQRIISNNIVYKYIYSQKEENALLVLPYPVEYLNSEDFVSDKFIATFINNFGRSAIKQIILTVCEFRNSYKLAIKNLEDLKSRGIKIGYKPIKDNIIKNDIFDYYIR